MNGNKQQSDWHIDAVIYQLQAKALPDSNHDGFGDFYIQQLGVHGMRLVAIPYLVECEGTNCETLPETHVVLKRLRAAMDAEFEDQIFLAETNQSPAEVSSYFGNGDECHMAFHFPVMPRIYMAVAQQDRAPIVDIMAQTPPIPTGCQWAIFLRNHDELTLEMVTPEEREFMYGHYAKEARMRINVGIRRRLVGA